MGSPHLVKHCPGCVTTKPVEEFYVDRRRGRDGYCKACRRDRDRARQPARNVETARRIARDPDYFRRRKLVLLYGITQEGFDEMMAAQAGVCAICSQPEQRVLYGKVARLVVDHDHVTGKVRALLCHRCNTALGAVENVTFRLAALAYLDRFA